MKIVIRADSSLKIGSGHVMRCLTLADGFRGEDISFICREEKGNLIEIIRQKGYKVFPLSADLSMDNEKSLTEELLRIELKEVDWLIIDHYKIGIEWEALMRRYTKKIMVIDDLSDKKHNCDLLLNQNLYENMPQMYDGLLADNCKKLFGPEYALLRREFIEARNKVRKRNGKINRILMFFGGHDSSNETMKTLKAMNLLNKEEIIKDVVIGFMNPNREMIRQFCLQTSNTNFYCQTDNMAELMLEADLAIGAAGSTSWERCCLGLPALVIIVADNQKHIAQLLHKNEVAINLGWFEEVDEYMIKDNLQALFDNPEKVMAIGNKAMKLVDGRGVERVKESIYIGVRKMKILFLGGVQSKELYYWLEGQGEEMIYREDKITLTDVKEISPDFVVSYNYRSVITKDIIDYLPKKIINLHISFLPYNRGAHPNIWSFLENTPRGVTIHHIDEGIDTGDIIMQKLIHIDDDRETLKSSYELLHKGIQDLFKEHWGNIKNGKIISHAQISGGSIHFKKDFSKIEPLIKEKGWDISIKELRDKFKNQYL